MRKIRINIKLLPKVIWIEGRSSLYPFSFTHLQAISDSFACRGNNSYVRSFAIPDFIKKRSSLTFWINLSVSNPVQVRELVINTQKSRKNFPLTSQFSLEFTLAFYHVSFLWKEDKKTYYKLSSQNLFFLKLKENPLGIILCFVFEHTVHYRNNLFAYRDKSMFAFLSFRYLPMVKGPKIRVMFQGSYRSHVQRGS